MNKKLSEITLEELWKLFPILLCEHNNLWKEWYLEEEKEIVNAVGKTNIERINHIGSTSVEGLVAKPTIDILLEIKKEADLKQLVKDMENIGYIFDPQKDKPAPHMMFMKGYTEEGFAQKVFHVHIRYLGVCDELYFRDYLRVHKDISDLYGNLKLDLKKEYEHNRDGYTKEKTEFVKKYTDLAKKEFPNRY